MVAQQIRESRFADPAVLALGHRGTVQDDRGEKEITAKEGEENSWVGFKGLRPRRRWSAGSSSPRISKME